MSGTLFDLTDPDLIPAAAVISRDLKYRYALSRRWAAGRMVNFVMLNPSKADAMKDDPTLRRCIGYAKAWGYDGLVATNLYAFRATDPKAMLAAPDPVGPEDDHYLLEAARSSALIVLAWGDNARSGRAARVVELLRPIGPLHALKLTDKGNPCHPLRLRADLKPFVVEDVPIGRTIPGRPVYPYGPPPVESPCDAHEEGMAAYSYGPGQAGHARLAENPYPPGSPAHFAWWEGWHDQKGDFDGGDDGDDE